VSLSLGTVSDKAKGWRPILMDCTDGRKSCHG
jgi:hypothetical protein